MIHGQTGPKTRLNPETEKYQTQMTESQDPSQKQTMGS